MLISAMHDVLHEAHKRKHELRNQLTMLQEGQIHPGTLLLPKLSTDPHVLLDDLRMIQAQIAQLEDSITETNRMLNSQTVKEFGEIAGRLGIEFKLKST